MQNQPQNPWLLAATLNVERIDPVFGGLETVDPGANFFVLALEALGAKTRHSCEGHPTGFYVSFEAPYELAMKIKSVGFFSVEIEGKERWSIRKTLSEPLCDDSDGENHKAMVLQMAAQSWVNRFGRELAKSPELASVLELPDAATSHRRTMQPR